MGGWVEGKDQEARSADAIHDFQIQPRIGKKLCKGTPDLAGLSADNPPVPKQNGIKPGLRGEKAGKKTKGEFKSGPHLASGGRPKSSREGRMGCALRKMAACSVPNARAHGGEAAPGVPTPAP